MRILWLSALVTLMACAPPPAVQDTGDGGSGGGSPKVTIIYPPQDIGTIALVDEGGELFLKVLIAVDFDNYEFLEPGSEPGIQDEPDRGHYHLYVNNVYDSFPLHQFEEFTSDANEFDPGDNMSFSVKLASHNHQELEGTDVSDVIEFVVTAPQ